MFVSQVIAAGLFSLPLASAAIIDVFVGGSNGLKFVPESVSAKVGDSIRFTFGTKNHTVTQSTFASPCTHMSGGFFSGYMPVSPDQGPDSFPQFWIPVKDTKPIWAFCSQGAHCQAGMVFAANAPAAPAANSFENYKAKAMGGAAAQGAAGGASTAAGGDSYGSSPGGGGGYGSYGTGTGGGDATSGYDSGYSSGYGAADASASASATSTAAVAGGTDAASNAAAGTVPVTHKVTVGGSAGLVFTPSSIQANPGDIVQFEFQVKNHTVTQSTFAAPCTSKTGGFDSGYVPVAATDTTFPTWSITVNDTQPVWAFCAQGAGAHCKAGMVFAINAVETSDKSFAAYQALAKGSTPAAASSSTGSGASSGGAYGNSAAGRIDRKMASVALAVMSAAIGLLL